MIETAHKGCQMSGASRAGRSGDTTKRRGETALSTGWPIGRTSRPWLKRPNVNYCVFFSLGYNRMIKVQGLTKRYARTVAVDNISFEVEKGQIVGFLGPNGAGKTTTM